MIKNIFLLSTAIFGFLSCSNDIDLNEVFKEIPVTYGVLNAKDTAHYVRIERVFNAADGSASELAKNSDSIYYKNITVKLKEVTGGKEYVLNMIDGNNDKHLRENGIFATTPNYLYKIKSTELKVIPGNSYRLMIFDKNLDTLSHSTIQVVGDMSIYLPSSNEKPLKLAYISSLNIAWEGGNNAGYYDVLISFNVKEKDTNGSNIWVNKLYTWKVDEYISEQRIRITGEDFYKFLGSTLESKDNIKRRFSGFDITVRGVGKELKEFIDILRFDSGITSSQQLPTYSNMSYGYGVFSSQNSVVSKGFLLDEVARDSLSKGVYTKSLNFEF